MEDWKNSHLNEEDTVLLEKISICVVDTYALELILAINHDLRYETPKNCKTVALIKVH